jgi:hypothetical protein
MNVMIQQLGLRCALSDVPASSHKYKAWTQASQSTGRVVTQRQLEGIKRTVYVHAEQFWSQYLVPVSTLQTAPLFPPMATTAGS